MDELQKLYPGAIIGGEGAANSIYYPVNVSSNVSLRYPLQVCSNEPFFQHQYYDYQQHAKPPFIKSPITKIYEPPSRTALNLIKQLAETETPKGEKLHSSESVIADVALANF